MIGISKHDKFFHEGKEEVSHESKKKNLRLNSFLKAECWCAEFRILERQRPERGPHLLSPDSRAAQAPRKKAG